MKILITGGHFSPAISLIESLPKEINVVFVGRKYTTEKEPEYSLEYKEVKKRNIPFFHLHTGRITRIFSLKTFLNMFLTPFGLFQSYSILKKEKPQVILSFGGYIGFPVSLAGFFLKIPIYIHEQTSKPGLANRMIGLLAKKVFISFEETRRYFPADKVILSGNPVRPFIFKIKKKPFAIFKNKPVIYVTGGSLGSHSINTLIEKILPDLIKNYIVIHQTGNVKEYGDYERLKNMKAGNYFVQEHFTDEEIGYVYQTADLIISRAGANTFFELISLKKPAIFIPLPWAANQEQQNHALIFKQTGSGEIFSQFDNPAKLILLIDQMVKNIKEYTARFTNLRSLYKENASEIIVRTILQKSSD